MRLSIWQEFSGNHSSRFTVIGQFESAEQAQAAADRLTALLKQIDEWYQQPENAEALEQVTYGPQPPPSPPEIRIARELGIEWSDYSIDWLGFDNGGRGPVRAFQQLVFVDGTESDLGSKPADALVAKLGGQVLVDGVRSAETGDWSEVYLYLTCQAPDESTARAIEGEIQTYLSQSRDAGYSFDTPWKAYRRNELDVSSFRGIVRREGTRLSIERGTFFHIAHGLPALLQYLRDKSCSGMEYQLVEEPGH